MAVTLTGALTDPQVAWFAKAEPGYKYLAASAIAHAAATATEPIANIAIPFACTLRAAWFVPLAAVSGADTNTTHLNLDNTGTDGGATGTELTNIDLTSGNDLTANAKMAFSTALSSALAAGDVLSLEAEKIGTGLAVPAGTLLIAVE